MQKISKALRNKRGVTLIELVVVMAILAIIVLFAVPRFLNYTKDAEVSAMQSDAKIISNAALQYHIEGEVDTKDGDTSWPVKEDKGELPEGLADEIDGEIREIDKEELSSYIQNTRNDIEDYVIVIDGEYEGEVFHKEGVEDRDGKTWYGVKEIKVEENNED